MYHVDGTKEAIRNLFAEKILDYLNKPPLQHCMRYQQIFRNLI